MINPINENVFYVGATSRSPNTRLSQHITESKKENIHNNLKVETIKTIVANGIKPQILELETCTLNEASFYEEFYINLFKFYGFTLLQTKNSTFTAAYKEGWNATRSREETPDTMGITYRVGREITKARREEGLSQSQLAKKTNTTTSAISAIENGHRNLSWDSFLKIADSLNRKVNENIFVKKPKP